MVRQVETSSLDLRYESHRLKNRAQERRLLDAIADRGIDKPLEGVATQQCNILLNGFKRCRCAHKLGIGIVPFISLAEDETVAIMDLLRSSFNNSLNILEQARFVDDLRTLHGMTVSEIAQDVQRSKAWVSMRLGLIGQMTAAVRDKLFSGAFPVYPYMYTLRRFMRMNGVTKADVEGFVLALCGKKLSVREIEQLAHGYFRGPASFREEIRKGNVALPLQWLREVPADSEGCNEFERVLLKDLELVQKHMQRVMGKSSDARLKGRSFHAQAHLLTAGLLSKSRAFLDTVRELHDRCGEA